MLGQAALEGDQIQRVQRCIRAYGQRGRHSGAMPRDHVLRLQEKNETLLLTGMGAAIDEGSGFVIRGRLDQLVPAGRGVLASMLGPGCASPARPWPTALGYMIP
jgi:hypothetical protein